MTTMTGKCIGKDSQTISLRMDDDFRVDTRSEQAGLLNTILSSMRKMSKAVVSFLTSSTFYE